MGDKVQATHEEWTVTLDNYVFSTGKVILVFTRMRAPYVNPAGFRFNVYRKGFFGDLAKTLGMQDIAIGDEDFDRAFIVKSSDEGRVRELLSDANIRRLIAQQPDIQFSVRDDEGWFGPLSRRGRRAALRRRRRDQGPRTIEAAVRTVRRHARSPVQHGRRLQAGSRCLGVTAALPGQ